MLATFLKDLHTLLKWSKKFVLKIRSDDIKLSWCPIPLNSGENMENQRGAAVK
jgi:hypothetical protein